MHFVHQFQCFEVFLKCVFDFFKTVFFLKNFVSLYQLRLIQSVFRSIKIAFKIFMESLSISINHNCCFDQSNFENKVFKKFRFDLFKPLFQKLFKTFSLSLSDSARLHNKFFVVFLLISCKVSLSISQYVHITLSFHLFLVFHAFFHALKGYFQT